MRLLSTRDICDRALRKIGAYAIRSSGARTEEMEEARYWLDMIIGHLGARQRSWWLVPDTGTITVTAGQAEYDLAALLGAATTTGEGVQFVIEAYLHDADSGEKLHDLQLVSRQTFEQNTNLDDTGEPTMAYVDRAARPTMRLYPVPQTGRSYEVRVLYQQFSKNFVDGSAIAQTNMRQTWNLYIVTALAAQIGNGPVRKLPADEVRDMKDEAGRLLHDLESYDSHEQNNTPGRVLYHDF